MTMATRSFGSFPREERRRENGRDMTKPPVRVSHGKPLTEEQRAELRELAKRPDSEIDVSDIPEWTDEMWRNAVRGRFYRPLKQQLTVRVDSDVLAWLKAQGKGYQTRINAILRQAMLRQPGVAED
jgi:uncharacterized protein (DUF4415 family)